MVKLTCAFPFSENRSDPKSNINTGWGCGFDASTNGPAGATAPVPFETTTHEQPHVLGSGQLPKYSPRKLQYVVLNTSRCSSASTWDRRVGVFRGRICLRPNFSSVFFQAW